jgi:hypothetical protein
MVRADSVNAPEQASKLPAGANPLSATLVRAGGGYVVLAGNGRAYTSIDGRDWKPVAAPFSGCACTNRSLTALSDAVWWASARDGSSRHYAVTLDAGHKWQPVPAPPSQPQQATPSFTAWTAASAAVQADHGAWITHDRGRHWTLIGATDPEPTTTATIAAGDPPNGLPGVPCGRDQRGSSTRYRPAAIALACGDNGVRATQLQWTAWSPLTARAKGMLVQNDCAPTCLRGHLQSYPNATFEFRGPIYNHNYSTVTITFAPGHRGPDGQQQLTRRI